MLPLVLLFVHLFVIRFVLFNALLISLLFMRLFVLSCSSAPSLSPPSLIVALRPAPSSSTYALHRHGRSRAVDASHCSTARSTTKCVRAVRARARIAARDDEVTCSLSLSALSLLSLFSLLSLLSTLSLSLSSLSLSALS